MAAKKIPYGMTDFVQMMTENYYYVDKTKYIDLVENSSSYLFLIRPRRFGKSLWLNVLDAYYDINRKEQFEQVFGNLYIGNHPTGNQNKYLMLKFNFSLVDSMPERLEQSFENHCNERFINFVNAYKRFFDADFQEEIEKRKFAIDKMEYITNRAQEKHLPIYLIIDEYDNFSNTILSSPLNGKERYHALTHGEGFLKSFFNTIKAATTANDAPIKKMFITGVSPVTLDDVTSGFNIADNISTNRVFNSLLGFEEEEVIAMMNYYKAEGLITTDIEQPLGIMRKWYDDYCFSKECVDIKVYNSDMVLYFLKNYAQFNEAPDILIDNNIRVDYGKLRHLIVLDKKLNGNFSVIKKIAEKGEIQATLNTSFPVKDLVKESNFVSLLFYFGIITIDRVEFGRTVFKVPNLTIKQMLFSYIVDSYKDTNVFRINPDKIDDFMFEMAYKGNWREIFTFLAEQVQAQTTIRDYIENEKAIQTLHLAYMNMFNYYLIYSEYELTFGYSDLWMQPNFMYHPELKYSYIVEFKYVKHSEKLNLEPIRKEAIEQLKKYAKEPRVIETKGNTELRLIYVIYHGWEMKALEMVE